MCRVASFVMALQCRKCQQVGVRICEASLHARGSAVYVCFCVYTVWSSLCVDFRRPLPDE